MQTIIQRIGTSDDEKVTLVVGIQGDNAEEIQRQWFSYANHGAAIQEELQDLGCPDKFGYFWSTQEKLLLAMERAETFRLLNKSDDLLHRYVDSSKELTPVTAALESKAREIARSKYDSFPHERFLKSISRAELEAYV